MPDTPATVTVEVEYHGPIALHNMPCAVCWKKPAVLEMNEGEFWPCWDCRSLGYELRQRKKSWFRRVLAAVRGEGK